jgi:uncharacterized protein YwgA
MRTERDKLLDAPLLLYIMKQATPIYRRTKLQKTTFLVEHHLKKEGLVGPHFSFFRYLKGPFSGQLWDTFDKLAALGFLFKTRFEPTDRGLFLIDLVMPELREHHKNRAVLRIMDQTLERYRKWTGSKLINYVYNLKVIPDDLPGQEMRVEDIPIGIEIITPPSDGLEISSDLEELIKQELAMTDEELEAARQRQPDLERQAFRHLSKILSAA